MLTSRRFSVLMIAAVVLLLTCGREVRADVVAGVDCEADPANPQCVVTAIGGSEQTTTGGSSGTGCRNALNQPMPCFIQKYGWLAADGCYYKPVSADLAAVLDALPPPAAWYEGTCLDAATGTIFPIVRLRVFGTPPGQALLVDEAVRRMRLPAPVIHVNPAPPAAQLVFVPAWLWVDSSSWGTRSATAAVPGLSVTATAKPVKVVWSTGDGGSVTCGGAGTPWAAGTDPMAASPDCGHTYQRPSGSSSFTLRATITWSVSWTGGGLSGTEPALTSTATVPLTVAESLAVNTSGGR